MVYSVAFDLDSTLGCFESVHPYLMVFFPDILQHVFKAPQYKGPPYPKLNVGESDKRSLALAFEDFVVYMAKKEHVNKLLRPGIIDIIRSLLNAKKYGLVDKMIIYSSNSNPYMLLFAHRLIQVMLDTNEPVFCEMVHWWHPLRDAEVRGPGTNYTLGHGPKTVNTIKKALKIPVANKDILFFDDIIHPDIKEHIPEQNYFHVERYIHYGMPLVIYSCFLYSLIKHKLDKKVSLLNEYKRIGLSIGQSNSNIQSFKEHTPEGSNVDVYDKERILLRLRDLFNIHKFKAGKKIVRKTRRQRLYRIISYLDL